MRRYSVESSDVYSMVADDEGFWVGIDDVADEIAREVAAERERCASICDHVGAMDALEGEDAGSAAMVRVADKQAALCAGAIRKGPQ